jgi:hypothetical protein
MPPTYVRSIEEEIIYEYAKLISRSALGRINYPFVSDRFKALRSGEATISGTIREWQKEQELPKVCVFCGAVDNLQSDHLIPTSRGGSDSADNLVLSCASCNMSRGDRGVFQWLGLKDKDRLHRLVAGKYLKQLYELHKQANTLGITKGEIGQLCQRCRNGDTCAQWDSAQKLTCFCLESVF